jgi:hypothetical protein
LLSSSKATTESSSSSRIAYLNPYSTKRLVSLGTISPRKHNPSAADDGPPIPSIQLEVHGEAVSIFVRHTNPRIGLAHRPKQRFPKKLSVGLRQPQSRRKDSGFMSAARMLRIEAIVAEFRYIHDCVVAARQLHLRRD